MTIVYRNMTRSDMEYAISWAAGEGWNPGLNDAELFYNADPAGNFMAFDGTEPVGAIAAVKYGDTFGFIGLFVVVPDRRGGLIGVKLGRLAMEYLKDRTVGLDGVLEKVRNYAAAGFKLAYYNARYRSRAKQLYTSAKLVQLADMDTAELGAYDSLVFPAPRTAFINSWIRQPGAVSLGSVKDGRLCAMGVARPCRNGYKIGPLFADNPDCADSIYRSLVSAMPLGAEYFLDIPEVNPYALSLVRQYHMEKVFSTARMYKNGLPNLPLDRIYGITSFELG